MAADPASHSVGAMYALASDTGRSAQEGEEPQKHCKGARDSNEGERRVGRFGQQGELGELLIRSSGGDSQRDCQGGGQSGRSASQQGGRSSGVPLFTTKEESALGIPRSCGEAKVKETVQRTLDDGDQEVRLWSPVGRRPTRNPEENRRPEESKSEGKLGWVTEDQRYIAYVPRDLREGERKTPWLWNEPRSQASACSSVIGMQGKGHSGEGGRGV